LNHVAAGVTDPGCSFFANAPSPDLFYPWYSRERPWTVWLRLRRARFIRVIRDETISSGGLPVQRGYLRRLSGPVFFVRLVFLCGPKPPVLIRGIRGKNRFPFLSRQSGCFAGRPASWRSRAFPLGASPGWGGCKKNIVARAEIYSQGKNFRHLRVTHGVTGSFRNSHPSHVSLTQFCFILPAHAKFHLTRIFPPPVLLLRFAQEKNHQTSSGSLAK
jgi:hypothetical protein